MYDTIIRMRNKTLYIIKYLFILAVSFSFALALFLFSGKSSISFADEVVSTFLTQTKIENTALSSPIDVYFGDEIIILQNNNEVLLSKGDAFITNTNFSILKQVKNFNEDYFLVSDDGSLYSVSKSDFTKTPLVFDSSNVGGNYFDINENFLITAYSGKATVYTLENGTIVSKHAPFDVKDDKPICINNNGQIFYVDKTLSQDTIRMINASALSSEPVTIAEISPEKMIANNEFLYLISNNKIFKINISNGIVTELTNKSASAIYDLGNIVTPSSLCFKGNNLVIADSSLDAAEEFSVSENSLAFTGYAIAKEKTAYNRISNTATVIDRVKDTLAIMDSNKLTIITEDANFDGKNPSNFYNFQIAELNSPSFFTLGNDNALLCYNRSVRILDIKRNVLGNEIILENGNFKDAFYHNGTFYVLTADGTNSYVYTLTALDTVPTLNKTLFDIRMEKICVSELNEMYYVDTANNVYKNENTTKNLVCQSQNHVTDIAIDLTGKIYLLNDTGTAEYFDVSLKSLDGFSGIKAMAMGYDKKQVYFVKTNEEFVYSTSGFLNYSIESTSVPQSFIINGANADLDALKVYTVSNNAVLYSVKTENGNFAYNGIAQKENEYVFITNVPVSGNFNLLALAGQNGIILVCDTFCTQKDLTTSNAPQKTFITTGVHVYFFPIITLDAEYTLTDGENLIRLNKSTAISPEKTISVLSRTFYYAKVTFNGNEYYGYIPKEFTVDVLAENKTYIDFETASLGKSTIYADQNLETALKEITSPIDVRLVKTENGVAEIYFLDGEIWLKGYVNETDIISAPNTSVRNAIIIFITVTCACSSAIYFILKKKDN